MAEIPVEKKSSNTWIWLLLAAILVALLVWWFAAEDDYDDEAYMASGADIAQSEVVNPDAEVNSSLAPATLATISADAQS